VSLFIGYTHSDGVPVRTVVDDLQRMGRSVWFDHQIHGGERWWEEIVKQIQAAEVFIFALSNDSWRSRPCRAELYYAEQLWVPVIPVQVGPLDSPYIKIAEQQIIDYRNRSADAVLALMLAVTELAAAPRQRPSPLPEPPSVPFEYLHRIASQIDVHSLLPEAQGQIIDELRRRLSEEYDELARSDILQLLRQLQDRQELTVRHAAEIDAIFVGAGTIHPAADGVTRLPSAHHWRQERATGSARKAAETPSQPRMPSVPVPESSAPGSQKQGPARDVGSVPSATAGPPPDAPMKPPAWQAGPSVQSQPSRSGPSGQERVYGHVFLSYSHSGDSAYAESLANHLTQSGIPVWFDKEIVVGDRWERVIKDQIDNCIALIVVMTPDAEASMWVSREINYAEAKKKLVFPLLLRGDPFFRLSNIQYENVTDGRMPKALTSKLRSLAHLPAT